MGWRGVGVAALAGLSLATSVVHADDPRGPPERDVAQPDFGPDEVVLKTGGTVRCVFVSVEPGHRVVLQVFGEKAPRTIPWNEVFRVERGKFARRAGPPDDSQREAARVGEPAPERQESERAPDEADDEPLGKGVVRLHVESDDPEVTLYEVTGDSELDEAREHDQPELRRAVCRAPCDVRIDARDGRVFWFGGEDVEPSEVFALGHRQGRAVANVDAGNRRAKYAGKLLTVMGLSIGGVSFAFGGMGLAKRNEVDDFGFGDGLIRVGMMLGGLGGLMTAVGIPLWVTSGTELELREASSAIPRMVAGNPLSWAW